MFKIEPNPTFLSPVSGFKPGEGAKEAVIVEFKFRDDDEMLVWRQGLEGKTIIEALLEVMVGWRDMPITLDSDGLAKMIKLYPKFANRVMDTYLRELRPEQVKN